MEPNIGISKESRAKVAEVLESVLADESMLYQKTKTFHWNVTGPQFIAYHKLFDEQAEKIAETIDEVAERIRSLGFFVKGKFSTFLKDSSLKEEAKEHFPALDMIRILKEGHETIIEKLREEIQPISEMGDDGTADFLTAIMEAHEKEAWFLRAHFE